MNKIVHINRNNTQKNQRKKWYAMSKENLELIKEVLVKRLWAEVILPDNFEAGDKTIEEILQEGKYNW